MYDCFLIFPTHIVVLIILVFSVWLSKGKRERKLDGMDPLRASAEGEGVALNGFRDLAVAAPLLVCTSVVPQSEHKYLEGPGRFAHPDSGQRGAGHFGS